MGVKSLWSLLEPVGRPVPLETVEGKALAIDSSIWIYQFQATMRDKEGRGLVNAHVLGFLRRICKLLFYGIRPVFVFDGGAPALKRNTIASGPPSSERKKKKSGAAASHAKIAEKLLAAQMRREALVHAQTSHPPSSKGKQRGPPGPVILDENAVYLEDLTRPASSKTPAKKKKDRAVSPPSSNRKNRFHDHDPYKLPDVNMEEQVAKATQTHAPDPRLATEEELRAFIEDMRPEDFDVTSPAFRELPTEVQYEIVGDLRLKSRQTSYKRLQNMLRKAATPLDFSREQIKNLKQRNALTQQLLMTTDSIGKAHITIPVRIASERNREYLLIKNEGVDGGWILGIRDEGTRLKPIEIDRDARIPGDDGESESDVEMEEVSIPSAVPFDADLREYQQTMALSAKGTVSQPVRRRVKSKPLFELEEEDELPRLRPLASDEEEEDPELATAIQASLDSQGHLHSVKSPSSRPAEEFLRPPIAVSPSRHDAEGDLYTSPSRLETALSIGGAGPRPKTLGHYSQSTVFGTPSLLLPLASALEDKNEGVTAAKSKELPVSPESKSPSPEPGGDLGHIADVAKSDGDVGVSSTSVSLSSKFSRALTPPPTMIGDDRREYGGANQVGVVPNEDGDGSRSPTPVGAVWSDIGSEVEMDAGQETGEFARFLSEMKGKSLDIVRHEIDEEISELNRQQKAAMRDSEDVTQHMISQIMLMLRLFGIPYITAPMEAEAQCAELVSLGLVDGIITDDSDVFLFGGIRVYKNMFNQSKTVECFLLSDLTRELGLERDTLVRLAYLLGSDYVQGLPGVGPVVAMELMKEFPGEDGLHKFKDWWIKVQSGRDREKDNYTKFRKRFKKKFRDLYLPSEWPNPLVRDAYYHPTVDSSEEPFKWGMPDLDALRHFLHEELGWTETKTDDLLLPIIQKMARRNQATSANRQGNLTAFLNVESGTGSYIPRKRQAYTSKRLQQVVSNFRKEQAKSQGQNVGTLAPSQDGDFAPEEEIASSRKRRRTTASSPSKRKNQTRKTRSRLKQTSERRQNTSTDSNEEEGTEDG